MFKVALTGLIGSGKSTASKVFSSLGISCYNTDLKAKMLMIGRLRKEIEKLLGRDSYLPDGSLNRYYIAERIFSDNSLRLQINSIVHPEVIRDFLQWARQQPSPYVLIETAILKESSIVDIVDKVIVVTASEEERIRRTILRDNSDEYSVRKRIRSQEKQDDIVQIADYIIDNSENKLIIPQILEINKIVLSLCSDINQKNNSL